MPLTAQTSKLNFKKIPADDAYPRGHTERAMYPCLNPTPHLKATNWHLFIFVFITTRFMVNKVIHNSALNIALTENGSTWTTNSEERQSLVVE